MSKDHPIVVKMTLKALVITASSIAVLLGVHLVKCQQLEPCTTVSSCDSVAYLISLLDSDDADDNLPMGMTRANVIRTLKSVVCRRERDEDGRLKVRFPVKSAIKRVQHDQHYFLLGVRAMPECGYSPAGRLTPGSDGDFDQG